MRPKSRMRTSRRVYAAAFAVMLAIPATAVALTARPSTGGTAAVAPTDTTSAIKANLTRRHVGYGKSVTVKGAACAGPARSETRASVHHGRQPLLAHGRLGDRAPRRQLPDDRPRCVGPRVAAGRQRGGARRAPPRAGDGCRPLQLQTGRSTCLAGHSSRRPRQAAAGGLGSQGAPRGAPERRQLAAAQHRPHRFARWLQAELHRRATPRSCACVSPAIARTLAPLSPPGS